jgi:hypothetical protein
MEKTKKKFPLTILEVVLLIILIPIVFYYCEKVLWGLAESGVPTWLPWWLLWPMRWLVDWFFDWYGNFWGPLIIVALDCLWITAMVFTLKKWIRIKIYTTLFILTNSVALLFFWAVATAFAGAMH